MSNPDPNRSRELPETPAAPEIFRAKFVRDTRSNFAALLIALTGVYLTATAIMRQERWPFTEAWVGFLFFYPILPYLLYYRTKIRMERKCELIFAQTDLTWIEDKQSVSMRWENVSRLHIASNGSTLVYRDPPKMSDGAPVPSLAFPYNPVIKELLVELADDKMVLPGDTRITHDDHPRFLPSPQKPNE